MILDVGCGKKKRGDIGIDYSRNGVADVIADAHHLPFRDNIFKKVISVAVLEHSFNPLNFIKEQFRVLKKNGTIELTTDNAQYYSWSVLGARLGLKHENIHADHYMIFYPKNVMRLFKLVGFELIQFSYIKNHRKLDRIVKIVVSLGILRDSCLFYRFKCIGAKVKILRKKKK